MPAPLLIADVPWLLYRSFFALPSTIADEQGRPVNALLGTVNALVGVIDARPPGRRPRCVVACTGAEQADYRVRLYEPYHAHREPMPEALRRQWDAAPGLFASLGWSVHGSEQLEADDVMYSFAQAEQERGGRALLVSGDRDMYAAVTGSVAVLELRKSGAREEIGPAEVRERYGVEPAQVADFIALRGDPSDGLPGAPGIGAKTAGELLRRFGSLEAALAAARALAAPGLARVKGDMSMRTAAALRDNEQLLVTFKQVATLQRIDVRPPADRETDFAAGARAARELGMQRLAERLAAKASRG